MGTIFNRLNNGVLADLETLLDKYNREERNIINQLIRTALTGNVESVKLIMRQYVKLELDNFYNLADMAEFFGVSRQALTEHARKFRTSNPKFIPRSKSGHYDINQFYEFSMFLAKLEQDNKPPVEFIAVEQN